MGTGIGLARATITKEESSSTIIQPAVVSRTAWPFPKTQQLAIELAARLSRPAGVQAAIGLSAEGKRSYFGARPDDIYEIASVTKVFTTTLLSLLLEQGGARLEDAAVDHLPPLRLDRRVRLIHLATHTSGLPRLPDALMRDPDPRNPFAQFGEADFLRALDTVKLHRDPGRRFQYSNLGSAVLGHVLAHRFAEPFERLVEHRVCEPLGLKDTRVTLNEAQRQRLKPGYDSGGKPIPHWELASFVAAGGLKSTTQDLLTFVEAQMDEAHPFAAAFVRARTPYYRRWRTRVGLGWFLSPLRDTTEVWHTGGTGGASSCVTFVPELRVGVAVLLNRGPSLVDILLWNRVERAGRKLVKCLIDEGAERLPRARELAGGPRALASPAGSSDPRSAAADESAGY
jgi:CubicO group peptidase (beta-lactamase class C family)